MDLYESDNYIANRSDKVMTQFQMVGNECRFSHFDPK